MKIGSIVKDVPVPTGKGGKYEWLERMEVGDSVNVVIEESEIPAKVRNGIAAAARRLGVKIVAQRDAAGELRVWRVAVPSKKRGPRKKEDALPEAPKLPKVHKPMTAARKAVKGKRGKRVLDIYPPDPPVATE